MLPLFNNETATAVPCILKFGAEPCSTSPLDLVPLCRGGPNGLGKQAE
jgi:hypothetical protein